MSEALGLLKGIVLCGHCIRLLPHGLILQAVVLSLFLSLGVEWQHGYRYALLLGYHEVALSCLVL